MSEKLQRAAEVWKRFGAWYGADMLERKYGLKPPIDWINAINKIDAGRIDLVMADIHLKFPQWLPTLSEFEQVGRMQSAKRDEPSALDQLSTFAMHAYGNRLTFRQYRGWRVLYDGSPRQSEGFAVVGLVIPSDGESQGYRIMVEDMRGAVA